MGYGPWLTRFLGGSAGIGWDEGVLGMKIGETARLTCTPDYAYGAGGFPAWGIMPNATYVAHPPHACRCTHHKLARTQAQKAGHSNPNASYVTR